MAPPAELNVGSIPVGEHDADWFRVMAAATGSSLRVKTASIVGYFVRRRKQEYEKIIGYLARKYGLEWDECFLRLLRGEDLGTPLKTFTVDPAMEAAIASGAIEFEPPPDQQS